LKNTYVNPKMKRATRRSRGPNKKGRRNRQGGMIAASGQICDTKMPGPMKVPAMRVFNAQLSTMVPILSDGAGKLASYLSFDPSSTTTAYFGGVALFAEWSAMLSLYNEVKLKQFEMSMCRTYLDESKGDNFYPIAFASTSSAILGSPTGYANVSDNGDAQMWPWVTDYSGKCRFISVKMSQLAWATVTTPNPGSTSGIAAGCPGSFIFYAAGLPASINIGYARIRGWYQFRTRV